MAASSGLSGKKIFPPCNLDNFDILYNISNNYYNDILSIDTPWITMNYG